MTDPHHERIMTLLADQATCGLSESDELELNHLLGQHPELDLDADALTAAALDLALSGAEAVSLPAGLRRRLDADARSWLAQQTAGSGGAATPLAQPGRSDRGSDHAGGRAAPSAGMGRSNVLFLRAAWLTAAAALLVAVVGWWPRMTDTAPDLVAARDQLLSQAGVSPLEWGTTETPDATAVNARGDVVWSDARQQGFMRFSGLAANDPGEYQYQLWIFDAERDEAYPVDGGVFDVDSDGDDIIVPIDARLPVSKATLFAVTVERPGGVVVSTRERIALLASVP